jgi:hypothetical protein
MLHTARVVHLTRGGRNSVWRIWETHHVPVQSSKNRRSCASFAAPEAPSPWPVLFTHVLRNHRTQVLDHRGFVPALQKIPNPQQQRILRPLGHRHRHLLEHRRAQAADARDLEFASQHADAHVRSARWWGVRSVCRSLFRVRCGLNRRPIRTTRGAGA